MFIFFIHKPKEKYYAATVYKNSSFEVKMVFRLKTTIYGETGNSFGGPCTQI